MAKRTKAPIEEPACASTKRKAFPIHGSPMTCRPDGLCIFCYKGFDVIEPVGYVKQKGTSGKKYYHARCMDPGIGGANGQKKSV